MQIPAIPVTLPPAPASNRVIRARADRWFDRFRRTGDPRLLAKVFDRTAAELWKVASHLCRDRHAAEDAVQGTFLVAIEAKHDWDATRPLLPWLLGLLVNRVRDLRRRQRAPEMTRVVPPAGEHDPADLAAHGELGGAVRDALQRVAEPYRDALERHLVHDQAAAEIAAATGVPAGTVRMRLHRGLDQLRRRLPAGFAGGAVAAVLTRESFAAMRHVVLRSVPGGAEVAAVGTASAGHFQLGWLGVILMKKTMMAVVAGLVLAGSWLAWQPLAAPTAPPAATVTATVRTLAAGVPPPAAAVRNDAAMPRRDAAAPVGPPAKGRLRVVMQQGGSLRPLAGLSLQVVAGIPGDAPPRRGAAAPDYAVGAFLAHGRTDAGGVATFEVPPGHAVVRSSLLGRDEKPWQTEVLAGQESELAITLPVLVTADVEVVDGDGRPLAGARILGRTITDIGDVVERELGRTGVDGRWRDQFVERGVPVRAVHDGYVASRAVDLEASTGSVRLVLAAGPATVAGTVFGSDGRPLPRAQVVIQPRVPGFAGARPLGLIADDSGRFHCTCVPPGPLTVLASSPVEVVERRCARSDAVAAAGRTTTADVRFPTGTGIVASITGTDGKPVAGQHVAAVWQPDAQLWIQLAAMASATTTTDARGIATLADVMPGEYEVQAFTPQGAKRTKVQLAAGQQVRLDWSFGAATFVEVQLVDDAGQPLADWVVTLSPESGTQREGRTGADGSVRFADVPNPPGQLAARGSGSAIPSFRTAAPVGRRTTLRVPAAALPTAALHGSVQPAAGLDAATITAELIRYEDGRDQGTQSQRLTAAATFRFEALPAGTYMLAFRRGERDYLGAPQRFVLAPGATLDTGAHALQPPTDLAIAVTAADGGPVTGPWLALALRDQPREFGTVPQDVAGQTLSMKGMPSGSYELLVWGEDIAPVCVPLTVTPAMATLPIVAARGTPTRFVWPGQGGTVKLWRDGNELLSVRLRARATTFGLAPGNYRIEVEAIAGRGAAEFTVGAWAGAAVEVALTK